MPSQPPAPDQGRTSILFIILFMLLLWLPTLDSVFHFDWTKARSENRAMAAWPKFPTQWRFVQTYVGELEAYFNDHFGCRKCLVQWHSKLSWSLFKEKAKPPVLLGKDGWFFYTDSEMLDHYTGQLQFTPQELRSWQKLLERRRDWLARRGITYVFIVAPDKHTIYSEELPDWVTKVRPQTKLDQFTEYMRAHSTVPVVDVRDVLREGKKIRPTYLKTDTHWNLFGGFLAYQVLMQSLATNDSSLAPLPLSSFKVTRESGAGGDMATMLGLSLTETNIFDMGPLPGLPKLKFTQAPLDRPKENVLSDNSEAKGHAICYRDSFAGCWIPFLAYHFNHVTYVWQYDLQAAFIEQDKPKIVVSEMLERFFNTTDPDKLMAQEALN